MRRTCFVALACVGLAAIDAIVPRLAGAERAQPRAYHGPLTAAAPVEPAPAPAREASSVPPPAVPRTRPGTPRPLASRPIVEPRSPVRVRPALDLTITIGAAAPTLGLGLWVEPSLPDRVPRPGSEPDIGKMDRIALGRYEPGPKIASDVLLAASIAAPLVYHAIEAGVRRRGWSPLRGRGFFARYATDLLILAESFAVNALLTEVLKAAIRRPRPYTYLTADEVDPALREQLLADQADNDADWSFPSGHTSTAFTAATAGATLLTLELLGRSRWAIALAWIGGLGMASATAVLRVAAGRHFPSDVITSALIGTGVGAAIPLAHWRPTPPGDYARTRVRERRWALLPTGGRGYTGATLIVPFR